MADNQNEEEVIIIEDDNSSSTKTEEEVNSEGEKKDKKLYFLLGLIFLILLLLMVVLILAIKKKRESRAEESLFSKTKIEKLKESLSKKSVSEKSIDMLIKKANILYLKGRREEALKLLNKLSLYSEALSNYNLGVLKIKEKRYREAINYFNLAIKDRDNRSISALNAAYCSLKLNDKKLFEYYSGLAEVYLPDIIESKSYPFYYALTHYYLGREFEALSALQKSTTYQTETKKLKSAIYNLYDDPYNLLDNEKDPFILGISYARIGEYQLAKTELEKVVKSKPLKAGVALALVELKLREYKNASKNLEIAKREGKVVYPITLFIKPEIFDLEEAQRKFKTNFLNKEDIYQLFFYYAPYKVFNINETMSYLKKGSLGLGLDNLEEAKSYLKKSSTISKLNIKMSKGIGLALNNHILKANKLFQKLVKNYPYHSILHYDLALTYAELKNFPKAYYHFLRAYHLDSSNYLAGVFALMAGKISHYKTDMIKRGVIDILNSENPDSKIYEAMISFIDDNYSDCLSFLESDYKKTPLNIAFAVGVSKVLNDENLFFEASTMLHSKLPKDIVSNLIYFYATHSKDDMKKFAFQFQPFLANGLKSWKLSSFFYGPLFGSELFLEFAKISGQLPKIKSLLEKKLLESDDTIPILQNLAFVDLYTKHFEESYTIFNDLIDNRGVDDYKTLFYGAVASILAGHHSNAVALLALSKRKNRNEFEARYGLGLLYHEIENLRGATIQYSKIPTGFESEFFDFKLKE